jgi:hypothetical protein
MLIQCFLESQECVGLGRLHYSSVDIVFLPLKCSPPMG